MLTHNSVQLAFHLGVKGNMRTVVGTLDATDMNSLQQGAVIEMTDNIISVVLWYDIILITLWYDKYKVVARTNNENLFQFLNIKFFVYRYALSLLPHRK